MTRQILCALFVKVEDVHGITKAILKTEMCLRLIVTNTA